MAQSYPVNILIRLQPVTSSQTISYSLLLNKFLNHNLSCIKKHIGALSRSRELFLQHNHLSFFYATVYYYYVLPCGE